MRSGLLGIDDFAYACLEFGYVDVSNPSNSRRKPESDEIDATTCVLLFRFVWMEFKVKQSEGFRGTHTGVCCLALGAATNKEVVSVADMNVVRHLHCGI